MSTNCQLTSEDREIFNRLYAKWPGTNAGYRALNTFYLVKTEDEYISRRCVVRGSVADATRRVGDYANKTSEHCRSAIY